jgi:hypothetical protein
MPEKPEEVEIDDETLELAAGGFAITKPVNTTAV